LQIAARSKFSVLSLKINSLLHPVFDLSIRGQVRSFQGWDGYVNHFDNMWITGADKAAIGLRHMHPE
jgi:hypothetical protein